MIHPAESSKRYLRCAGCRELKTGVRLHPLSGRLICEECRASGAPGNYPALEPRGTIDDAMARSIAAQIEGGGWPRTD
jgi:recombinational DNA repair protein (RecF pathway)